MTILSVTDQNINEEEKLERDIMRAEAVGDDLKYRQCLNAEIKNMHSNLEQIPRLHFTPAKKINDGQSSIMEKMYQDELKKIERISSYINKVGSVVTKSLGGGRKILKG